MKNFVFRKLTFFVTILTVVFCLSSLSISQTDPGTEPSKVDINTKRRPNLPLLYEKARSADNLVIVTGRDEKVLYESRNRVDIDSFVDVLDLSIPEEWRMAVCSDPFVRLYRDGKEVLSIGLVGGDEILSSIWSGNAIIRDVEKWLNWFDDRGLESIRKEYLVAIESEKKYQEDESRWHQAMPNGIKDLYEQQLRSFSLPSWKNTSNLQTALKREFPDRDNRILAILFWFGSGSGPWNGTPAYESVAENILLSFATKDIVEALEGGKLEPQHLEGAARYFSGWELRRTRPNDPKLISDRLHNKLSAHVAKSGDVQKMDAFRKMNNK